MTFIGRTDDLAFLQDCYEESKAQLVVLYGRRRIGKTETLSHFAQDKPCLFFSAQMATKEEQLSEFSRRMFEEGAPAAAYLNRYADWRTALEELTKLPSPADGARRLVVIDEFPYLVKADPSLPSVLQNLWDHTLRHANLMIVLCGSAMKVKQIDKTIDDNIRPMLNLNKNLEKF